MTVGSRLLAALADLPPAHSRDIAVEKDLRVPMRDGVILLADRYYDRTRPGAPIVLMRSPYGRRRLFGVVARVFAERGFQAVVQSCRGTFGSGGTFEAFRHETTDGRATLDWIAQQAWSSDALGMFGASYLGSAQWAIAGQAPSFVRAFAMSVTASDVRPLIYPGGALALETHLAWLGIMATQELPVWRALFGQAAQRRRAARAAAHLPLSEADLIAVGTRSQTFQDWLTHEGLQDEWWRETDWSRHREGVEAPVALVAGWHDLYAAAQLRDYVALRAAGTRVRLVVGPWTHLDPRNVAAALREALDWFDAHLRGRPSPERPPVRVFVMGSGRWIDLPDWPPDNVAMRWHLHAHGRLAESAPSRSDPERYRYDPADPTPSVGGAILGAQAGPRDNRRLEARSDVLTFTTSTLEWDLEVIGPVSAELHVRSSARSTDFFVRVCDVSPSGRSINVSDGLARLDPRSWRRGADGVALVDVELSPTAYRFKRGHRVRVQVSSGAHPRFARNLGTGEAIGSAVQGVPADQEIFHDPSHPSALVLPVVLPMTAVLTAGTPTRTRTERSRQRVRHPQVRRPSGELHREE